MAQKGCSSPYDYLALRCTELRRPVTERIIGKRLLKKRTSNEEAEILDLED